MLQWLKSGFVDLVGQLAPRDTIQPTIEGVPQG